MAQAQLMKIIPTSPQTKTEKGKEKKKKTDEQWTPISASASGPQLLFNTLTE